MNASNCEKWINELNFTVYFSEAARERESEIREVGRKSDKNRIGTVRKTELAQHTHTQRETTHDSQNDIL